MKNVVLTALLSLSAVFTFGQVINSTSIAPGGSASYFGALYHMNRMGLYTTLPDARLHINYGNYDPYCEICQTESPFLIDGKSKPFYEGGIEPSFFVDKTYFIVTANGHVGVNEKNPTQPLHVNGNAAISNGRLTVVNTNGPGVGEIQIALNSDGSIHAREVLVDLGEIPDYVFREDYSLMSLSDLKKFVEREKHLPNIRSEAEFKEEGNYALGEMNRKLLEKIEELTLYVIDLQEQINSLKEKKN